MPTLDEVYRNYGEVAELAQLLETELGNCLVEESVAAGETGESLRVAETLRFVNRQTLGALVRATTKEEGALSHLEGKLARALDARNRLSHSFFRSHNFRRNSDEGRSLMLADLEAMRLTIMDAYKAVLLLYGVDVDSAVASSLPTRHLPI